MSFQFDKENFRVIFRAILAAISILYVGAYAWNITFLDPEQKVGEQSEFILGFLLGTLIATLINYYFGGSEDDTKQKEEFVGGFAGPAIHSQPIGGVPSDPEVVPGDDA
jgi:hypothetical protein